jgi:hypothetical protein
MFCKWKISIYKSKYITNVYINVMYIYIYINCLSKIYELTFLRSSVLLRHVCIHYLSAFINFQKSHLFSASNFAFMYLKVTCRGCEPHRSYRVSCSAPPPPPTLNHWPRDFETQYECDSIACGPIKALQPMIVCRSIIMVHCGNAFEMYGDHLSSFGVSISVDISVDIEIPDYLFIYTCVCVCVPAHAVMWESSAFWPYLGSLFCAMYRFVTFWTTDGCCLS